ncbi:Rrn10p Ecym_2354 [Eremothecium cymbalariae DBVPG|uniref:Uncharacterized protein n=1 Tax=Eremothecium cymbalariae (strain CBS 270.75 / DBVPG 7215 / KCTC 17166 / NRRL Y-17582) TaxID=931890 RepID=G8JNM0_ERECY|nr:Hypothetical protein Ecym_2354 [Eremothecium cymbalariae DBVPG\
MDPNVYEACSDLIYKFHGPSSADEVLADKVNHLVPVPLPSAEEIESAAREELETDEEVLPHMDLKVLHYFLTQLVVQKYPHLINCFDETSLIAVGMMVEELVQQYARKGSGELSEGAAMVITKMTNYRESPSNI